MKIPTSLLEDYNLDFKILMNIIFFKINVTAPSESADTMLDPSAWPQLLKQAVVPVVSLEDCRGEKGYENKLTNNMVCAGFTEGKVDSCAVGHSFML